MTGLMGLLERVARLVGASASFVHCDAAVDGDGGDGVCDRLGDWRLNALGDDVVGVQLLCGDHVRDRVAAASFISSALVKGVARGATVRA